MAYAGIAADTVYRESQGSLTLTIANFSSVQSSLWSSGLPNAVAYWTSATSAGAISVSATTALSTASGSSSGLFFYLTTPALGAAANSTLFVLSRI